MNMYFYKYDVEYFDPDAKEYTGESKGLLCAVSLAEAIGKLNSYYCDEKEGEVYKVALQSVSDCDVVEFSDFEADLGWEIVNANCKKNDE